MASEAENQLDKFLGFGLYQLLIYIAMQYSSLSSVLNTAFMTFGGYKPKWTCNDFDQFNVTNQKPTNNCKIYATCSNLTFHTPFYSIISEWDLNCEQKYVAYFVTSIQMVGIAVGAMIVGQLSDLYGRKYAVIITSSGLTLFGGLSALSPNWQAFCAFRFLIGFLLGGSMGTKFVYLTEFSGKKHRLWMNAMGGSPLMYMIYAGLAYSFPTWRKLAMIGNLISIPTVFMFLLLEESPRWLIQHQRTAEAHKILTKINRFNRRNFSEEEIERLITDNQTKKLKLKDHSICHLFSKKATAIQVLVLSLTWFTVSTISYGILLNVDSISGDPFLNMVYFGALRCGVSIGVVIVDGLFKNFGRKMFHLLPEITIFISCVAITAIIVMGKADNYGNVIRILALCSAGLCSCLWLVAYLLTAELFSTSVRTLANSFCSLWARFGGMVVPQVLLLAHYWEPAPYVWFGFLIIIDIIAFQFVIPETKGCPLSEHHNESKIDEETVMKT